jgi:hypothetical protein
VEQQHQHQAARRARLTGAHYRRCSRHPRQGSPPPRKGQSLHQPTLQNRSLGFISPRSCAWWCTTTTTWGFGCPVRAPQLRCDEERGASLSRQRGLSLVDRWLFYDSGL